jgi:hypothetical protein
MGIVITLTAATAILPQLFVQPPQKSPVATQLGVSVTAKINQDQAQQAKHENECYNSAKQQSGLSGRASFATRYKRRQS